MNCVTIYDEYARLSASDDFGGLVQLLPRIQDEDPFAAEILNCIGYAQIRLRDYIGASRTLHRARRVAIAGSGTDAKIMVNLAYLLNVMGAFHDALALADTDRAKEYCQEAQGIHAWMEYERAYACFWLGQFERATAVVAEFVASGAGGNQDKRMAAMTLQAAANVYLGRHAQAELLLEQVNNYVKYLPHCLDIKAHIAYAQNRAAEAYDHSVSATSGMEALFARGTQRWALTESYLLRAAVCLELGRHEEAKTCELRAASLADSAGIISMLRNRISACKRGLSA